jgi:hypothetical protein
MTDSAEIFDALCLERGGKEALGIVAISAARALAYTLASPSPNVSAIAALTSLLPNPINHKIEVAVEYVDNLIGRCRHCGHCEPMPEPQPVVCRSCGSVCCEGLDVALKHKRTTPVPTANAGQSIQPTPEPQTDTVVPIRSIHDGAPLKGPDEPWRPWINRGSGFDHPRYR